VHSITDETVGRYSRLVETVRAEGATILLQMTHLGAFARSEDDVLRPPLPGFENTQSAAGETTHRKTTAEIELMINGYRRTAQMAASVGFDGVEVHGAHGYIVQQSLTPAFSSRDNEWGRDGTLFVRRLLAVARAEMRLGRIVGYRTPTDDLRSPEDGGIGFAAIAEVVRTLLAAGRIDVLNMTIGGGASYARAIPNYRYGQTPNLPAVARLRSAVVIRVPVIGAGRIILSPSVAASLLTSGTCDLVAMTTAHIADPDLVAKVRRRQAHRIHPCVGVIVCVKRKLQGYPEISCFHNPEVPREAELAVRPPEGRRRLLVVGAGPAKLKSAEVLARRGHDVTVDEGARPGGRLRSVEKTTALGLVGAIDHLVAELAGHGVRMHSRTMADEAQLRELAPEHLVLATGDRPVTTAAYPEAADGGVTSSADAPAAPGGAASGGGRVLPFDDIGANEGPLVAEELARRGATVVYVTSCETVMPWLGQLHRYEVPAILRSRCERPITGGFPADVDSRHVIVVHPDAETIAELDIDALVPVVAPRPALELAEVLERLAVPDTIAGDALAPPTAMHAFKDGYEAVPGLS
jgi:2,4-dienoyl-CoA reductase-like NADH-dependent reductase (Old Yellow Enzyme family)